QAGRSLALGGHGLLQAHRGERGARAPRSPLARREGARAREDRRVRGFTVDRIREFEANGVPVDSYGIGSSLLRGSNDYTADVVLLEGEPCAKVGREFRPNPR